MLTLLCSLIVLGSAQTASVVPVDLKPEEKIYGLSLFWKEASDHFVFFDKVPDLDWDKTYREYLPKVLATKSTDEYYTVLSEFAGLLHDSHTGINPPPRQGPARPGGITSPHISVGWDKGVRRLWVYNVAKRYASEVPPGSEIVEVEGKPLVEYVQQKWGERFKDLPEEQRWSTLLYWALMGPPDQPAKFTVVTPTGQRRQVEMPRKRDPKEPWAWDAWPDTGPVVYKDLGGGIAYVALNTFSDMKTAEEFEKLIPTLEKAKGIVIDLRKNGGGNDLVGMRICQNFTTGSFKSFASRTREVKSAYKAWGGFVDEKQPNLSDWDKMVLQHYKGKAWFVMPPDVYQGRKDAKLLMPKVVLIGNSTASAAEDTLIYMDDIPTITTVGQHTFGGTGQPLMFDLPGGGSARVCTQHCYLPDGREFMGVGIQPKVAAPEATVLERIAGKDPTLDKGLEVLRAKLKG